MIENKQAHAGGKNKKMYDDANFKNFERIVHLIGLFLCRV
jgi:hypothetical protein